MANILIVDDESSIRRMLDRMLTRQGHTCSLSVDAAEARKCLEAQTFELVLCDVNMPGESGIDLARHIQSQYQDTAVVMVTGVDDPQVADEAIAAGAYGYINKPLDANEVIINIRNGLRRRELEIANRRYQQDLEQMVQARTDELEKILDGLILVLGRTVEIRDPYTAGHQRRVAELACAIVREMGLSEDRIKGIRMAGLIHDLGKIAVPVGILSKPGQLLDTEFNLIKGHPERGYEILQGIHFPWPLAEITLQHHERIDGSGYAQELKGEEILPEARILAVADVVEAISSHRPYRSALGIDAALEEIHRNKGLLYDENAVDACLKLFEKKKFQWDSGSPRPKGQ